MDRRSFLFAIPGMAWLARKTLRGEMPKPPVQVPSVWIPTDVPGITLTTTTTASGLQLYALRDNDTGDILWSESPRKYGMTWATTSGSGQSIVVLDASTASRGSMKRRGGKNGGLWRITGS